MEQNTDGSAYQAAEMKLKETQSAPSEVRNEAIQQFVQETGHTDPVDQVQNNNFNPDAVKPLTNPLMNEKKSEKSSVRDRFKGLTDKFKKAPEDPVDAIRKRETQLAANNPNANVDERVEQSILREIRDGNGTIEQKQALYNRLSPETQRVTPAPRPEAAVAPQQSQQELQRRKDELMNAMLTNPNENTQNEIRNLEQQLKDRFGVVPLNERLSQRSEAQTQETKEPPLMVKVTDKGNEPVTIPVTVVTEKPNVLSRTFNRFRSLFNSSPQSGNEGDVLNMPFEARQKEAMDWLRQYAAQNPGGLDANATNYIQTHFGADVLPTMRDSGEIIDHQIEEGNNKLESLLQKYNDPDTNKTKAA